MPLLSAGLNHGVSGSPTMQAQLAMAGLRGLRLKNAIARPLLALCLSAGSDAALSLALWNAVKL
jgi:hypothetical protein